MNKHGVLYWITGLSGAGKTTIGNQLYYELKKKKDNIVLLDGDILKNVVGDEVGYTEEDRRKRAMKYARICKMLTDQGMVVICCTIAMYDEVRKWNRENNKGYVEVFLNVPIEVLKERDQKGMYSQYRKGKMENLVGIDMNVEFPKTPDIVLQNDGSITIKQCVDKILEHKVSFSSDFDRDTDYWNQYYMSRPDIKEPSLFAKEVGKQLKKSGNLLELGCGNGRDSIYFYKLGLNVTGIDASDAVISELSQKYKEENICFICDDFVCSSTLFVGQFDYCYSRFSLHAINEEQESEVLSNVYKGLKDGGKLFVEVRSVNDELYGCGELVGRNAFKYNGHYRRFIVRKELEEKLVNVGYEVEYSEEARNFAPFGESNPKVIRIIAKKKNDKGES